MKLEAKIIIIMVGLFQNIFKNKDETDALSNIDHELSFIDTVGMADYSDIAKISIVGKDATGFFKAL